MKLEKKVAIVTGGGRGIGRAIALTFAQEGADVVVTSRTPAEIEATTAEIKVQKRRALAIPGDVSNPQDVTAFVERSVREFGTVHILVNNAGVQGPIGPLVNNDVEHWMQTIQINLVGTFLCCRAVLPVMIQQGWGKIINLSGGGATSPRPYFTAYAASKAAVVRLTETLAEEVKEYNIQVNAIAPGAVNTHMLDQILAAGEAAGEKALGDARRQLETGGTSPEKATALAVFLASDESDGLTGKLISALHDDWQGWRVNLAEVMSSPMYTLRRLDPFTLRPLIRRLK